MATPTTTARDKSSIEPIYLAEITLKGPIPPTLFFSTRQATVDNQLYENYLDVVTGIDESVKRNTSVFGNSNINIKFKNDPFRGNDFLILIGDTNPFEGATCVIKEVYLDNDGVTASSPVTVYQGVLEAPRNTDLLNFDCRMSSKAFHQDRLFRAQFVDVDTFPDAFEDVGKIVPHIYGAGVVVPTSKTDWGEQTTLVSDINDSITTITVSDSSRYPAPSGSIFIDDEEISYTGNTNNQFTGCTRGVGATDNVGHAAATPVWEKKALYWSVIGDHVMDAINVIYAEIENRLWRVVSGAAGNVTGGRHYVRATEQLKVAAVEDDLSISDGIGIDNDYSITEKRVTRWANNLPVQIVSQSGNSEGVEFDSAPAGTLADIVMEIEWQIVVTSNPVGTHTFRLDDGSGDIIATVATDGTITSYMDSTIKIAKGSMWDVNQPINSSRISSGVWFNIVAARQLATITSAFSGDPDGGRVSRSSTDMPHQANDWGGDESFTFPSAPSGNLENIYAKFKASVVVTSNPAGQVRVRFNDTAGPTWFFIETDGSVTFILPQTAYFSYATWQASEVFHSTSASGTWFVTWEQADQFAITDDETSVSVVSKTGTVTGSGGVVATHLVDRFFVDVDGYADPDGNYGGAASLIESPAYIIKHFRVRVVGDSLANDIDSASFDAAFTLMEAAVASGYKFAFVTQRGMPPSRFAQSLAFQSRSALYYTGGRWTLDFIPDSAPAVDKTITKEELAGRDAQFRFSKALKAGIINDLVVKYARDYMMFRGNSPWDKTVTKTDATSQTKYSQTYPKEIEFPAIKDDDTAGDVADFIILQQANTLWRITFPIFWEHFNLGVGQTFDITNTLYNGKKFFVERFRRIDQASAMVEGLEWPS